MSHQYPNEFKDLHVYEAHLIKVIDGDTVVVDVDLGFNIFYKIRLRLEGIDTDNAAKKVLKRLLYMNWDGDSRKLLFIETEKTGWPNGDDLEGYLATIWLPTKHMDVDMLDGAYTEMFNHEEWLSVNEYMRDHNEEN